MPGEGKVSAYQFHDNCEKKAYTSWINRNLFRKELASNYLPIYPVAEEIFDQICDGVLFCEILLELFPQSIDPYVIKCCLNSVDRNEKIKNLNLAYETARSHGCNLRELRIFDIFSGVRQSVLEFLWQIFSVGLVNSIQYEKHQEMVYLKEPDETIDTLKSMKPLEILIRYVNYRINKFYPTGPKLKNLDDLQDGHIYMFLLSAIALDRNIELPNSLERYLNETSEVNKFHMLIDNFHIFQIFGFINDDLLKSLCSQSTSYKMHILTLAEVFHKYNIIEPTGTISSISEMDCPEKNIQKETLLEKLCRNFINFQGIQPICTNLTHDCKDGLLLMQLLEIFEPNLFKKERYFKEFDEDDIESQRVCNCSVFLKKFQRFYSLNIDGLYPEYIASGKTIVICKIIYNIIMYWAVNGQKDDLEDQVMFDKRELLNWVNSIDSKFEINSFRDIKIEQRHIIAHTLDEIFPKCIDWEYYNSLEIRMDRYIYLLSVGRKEGVPLFMSPEMLTVGDHYSIMLVFAMLRYNSQQSSIFLKGLKKQCPTTKIE